MTRRGGAPAALRALVLLSALRRAHRRPRGGLPPDGPGADALEHPGRAGGPGISRRGLLAAGGLGVGVVGLTVAGQSVTPLRGLGLLATRRPEDGPLGVPINRLASQADVRGADTGSGYRLRVLGGSTVELDVAALEALPSVERSLPLACVEGWSVQALWRGPMLLDLVREVGGDEGSRVVLRSLQRRGAFSTSEVVGPQLREAVLATHLNGQRLTLDHGYPLRLIAPNRAGVHQTKWLTEIEVSP